MKRHKKDHDLKTESDSSEPEDRSGGRHRENQFHRSSRHHRQSSDTTHDRSPNRDGENRHRRHRRSDSEDDAEDLPARFDSHGKPLEGGRQGKKGLGLASMDPEQIQKLVSGVSGALEGRRSWASVIGDVLGGDLLGQLGPLAGALQAGGAGIGGGGGVGESEGGRREIEDEDGGDRRHKRRR
jgi:hypothetical protein